MFAKRNYLSIGLSMTLTALAALAEAADTPIASSPPPQAFVLLSAARPPESHLLAQDATELFDVEVDLAAVAANPETLTLELPQAGLLEALRSNFVDYQPDWKSWHGTLRYFGEDGPGTGYINLNVHGNRLSALIDFEGERFRIVAEPDGKSHSLIRLENDAGPLSCGMSDAIEGDLAQHLWAAEELYTEETSLSAAVAADTVDCPATFVIIDVLAVYPRAFFEGSEYIESQITDLAQQAIAQANQIFWNSHVRAAYRLRGPVPLVEAEPPIKGMKPALEWMNTGGGNQTIAPEVAELRAAFAADVVVMFVPTDWLAQENQNLPACGYATLPLARPVNGWVSAYGSAVTPSDPVPFNRAFSVNRFNCGLADFTLAHEIGHNYGMRHHESQEPDPRPDGDYRSPNARGFIFPPEASFEDRRATLMACVWRGGSCNRIGFFSDPERDLSGRRPSGLENAGAIGDAGHNDRAAACNEVERYSAFFPATAYTPPLPSFTVTCSGLTCSFNGLGSYDGQGSIQTWRWDFGDGTAIDRRSTPSHTYAAPGTYRIHLVVKDNDNQTAVRWSTVTVTGFQSYPPTGWVDGYDEQHVWGWACDPDFPTQGNRVNFYTTSWQYLGSAEANHPSSAPINNACRGGSAHYFDFYHYGGIAPGMHFIVWSLDLPPGTNQRPLFGTGGIGDGTEFVMPGRLYPPKGWVDGYDQQHVWGWACDPDFPASSNRVDFWSTSWQYLGSAEANHGSSAPISYECGGGWAHYFVFDHYGSIPSGTHFMVWSIDLPYSSPNGINVPIGGSGSIGDGTEFVMP